MKLAAISMIRDEADIIAPFLRHLDAMFDIVFLLDQRSSDGSTILMKAACSRRENWRYFLCDFSGRYQKEATNLVVPKAFELGADALFILDADEFVALDSPDELRRLAMDMQTQAAAGRFFWRACVPAKFDQWHFDPDAPAWTARQAGKVQKVALSRALFEQRPDLRFCQGNHSWANMEHEPPVIELGDLYHFPLRSRAQAARKTFIASIANFSKGNMMKDEDWHVRRLLALMAGEGFNDAALAGYASLYGDECARTSAGEMPQMRIEDFERRVPSIVRSDLPLPELEQPDLNAALAQALLEFKLEPPDRSPPALDLCGEVISLGATPSNFALDQSKESPASQEGPAVSSDGEESKCPTPTPGAIPNANWFSKTSKAVRSLLRRRVHGA